MFPQDRMFSATELERYAVLPLPVLPEQGAEGPAAGRAGIGSRLHASGAAWPTSCWPTLHRRVNAEPAAPESPAACAETNTSGCWPRRSAKSCRRPGRDSLADALREIDRRMLLDGWPTTASSTRSTMRQWEGLRPAACVRRCSKSPSAGPCGKAKRRPRPPSRWNWPATAKRFAWPAASTASTWASPRPGHFQHSRLQDGRRVAFSPEAVARGTALQLPLYALAAAELILNDRDAVPWQAGYWYISGDGFKPRQALRMYELAEGGLEPRAETWEAIRGILADTVVGLVRGDARRASSPSGATTPTAPAAARITPSAASTRSARWRRHGSRRHHDADLTEQQAAGDHRPAASRWRWRPGRAAARRSC